MTFVLLGIDQIALSWVIILAMTGSAAFCCWLGYLVGGIKGNQECGGFLGLLLGPLGILITALLPEAKNTRRSAGDEDSKVDDFD